MLWIHALELYIFLSSIGTGSMHVYWKKGFCLAQKVAGLKVGAGAVEGNKKKKTQRKEKRNIPMHPTNSSTV